MSRLGFSEEKSSLRGSKLLQDKSQEPTGSDYPIFRLILLRKHLIAFDFYSSFLVSSVKYGFSIGEKYGKRIVAINFEDWGEGLIALSFGHQYSLFS